MVGWMPLASSCCAADNRLPAITTTDVVPSPASISCALESSTSYNEGNKHYNKINSSVLTPLPFFAQLLYKYMYETWFEYKYEINL